MPCGGTLPSLGLLSRKVPAMSGNCSPGSMTKAIRRYLRRTSCPEVSVNNAGRYRGRYSKTRQDHPEHSSQGSGQHQLATIPGIGPIVASCLSASVPDAGVFRCDREFAAWIGLVPRQHSTGGKPRLGHISKMGNRQLRKLLVVGAHVALYSMKNGKTRTALADWARSLLASKPFKLVAVALANKIARIAWAVMARGTAYEPKTSTVAASA